MLWGSSAKAGPARLRPAATATPKNTLHVRIALHFRRRTGMRDSSVARRTDALGVLPQRSAPIAIVTRLPGGFASRQFFVTQFHRKRAGDRVHADDVAVAQEPDGAAERRLGADMADAKAARAAGETPIRDQRHLLA